METLNAIPWERIAQLVGAVASLAWPIVLLVLIFTFKSDLRGLLSGRKLKRGKFPWLGEIELEKELDQLNQATQYVEIHAPVRVPAPGVPDTVHQILIEAGTAPKAALMMLAAEMEKELRRILEASGVKPSRTTAVRQAVDVFVNRVAFRQRLLTRLFGFGTYGTGFYTDKGPPLMMCYARLIRA